MRATESPRQALRRWPTWAALLVLMLVCSTSVLPGSGAAPPAPPRGAGPAAPAVDFAALVAQVRACRACPRMAGRRRVLGDANGPLRARAVLVGTAPGRYGAERTGIPFSGDRSGAALDVLLARAGLRRDDVFITNAVLCNPQDAGGRNDEPSAAEL